MATAWPSSGRAPSEPSQMQSLLSRSVLLGLDVMPVLHLHACAAWFQCIHSTTAVYGLVSRQGQSHNATLQEIGLAGVADTPG